MKIIVGLGNPGRRYQNTRHNAGWLVLDALAKKLDIKKFEIKGWRLERTLDAQILKGRELILVKPMTFMNTSGNSANKIPQYLNISISQFLKDLWVVHDDLDLPLGSLKISRGKGSAGHKGVESIIESLETDDFVRFRVGIGDIKILRNWKLRDYESYVLGRFKGEKKKLFEKMIEDCAEAVLCALGKGLQTAMNKYNYAMRWCLPYP